MSATSWSNNPNPRCAVGELGARALYHIVFEADTRAGKAFDLGLIVVILVSLVAVMAESVDHINRDYGSLIKSSEWIITALFSAEYILRLLIVRRPWRYARSFFGIVDLLSVLPSYLSFFFAGAQALAVIRVLRVLRIFRLLKLPQFVGEAEYLATALALSTRKIVVFLGSVVTLVVILGAVMYLVEGPESGFDSIPRSMYWAVVTLTTVGYGDIAPKSAAGQAISALVMILGYAIIAVPTGIVSAEMVAARRSLSVCGHVLNVSPKDMRVTPSSARGVARGY